MTLDEVVRRLMALERRVPGASVSGSPGLSTAGGAAATVFRDRFPVELTSTFDAESGYSWERVYLTRTSTSGSVTTGDSPQSGDYAFTPDNDTTLQPGERGWLEADPTAAGWIFLKSKAGLGGAGGCNNINAGMDTDDCLKVTVVSASGLCSTIDTEQEVYLAWDAGDSRWEAAAAFDHTGSGTDPGDVNFGFTNGVPWMTIAGVYGTPQGCDDGGLVFAFGGATLCAGGTETTCENYFVVKVECSCCPITGWDGEGWYCIVAAGDTCGVDQQYCVELLDADKCDADVVICSGPYASESSCLGSCTGAVSGVVVACCANAIPETVYAHIGSTTGDCGINLSASIPLVYDSGSGTWKQLDYGTYGTDLTMSCSGSNWVLNSTRSFGGGVATSTTCSPLSIVFPVFNGGLACTGTFVVTVNETP